MLTSCSSYPLGLGVGTQACRHGLPGANATRCAGKRAPAAGLRRLRANAEHLAEIRARIDRDRSMAEHSRDTARQREALLA
jgi:hypothetical protein